MKNNYQDVLDQAMQSHQSVFYTGRTAASENHFSPRAYVKPNQAQGRNQESGMANDVQEPGFSSMFLTSINPNQSQQVKKVNRISYISPPRAVEKVVEVKPEFTLKDLVVPPETDVIQTENQMFQMQDTLTDANRDIRKQTREVDQIKSDMASTSYTIMNQMTMTQQLIFDSINEIQKNLHRNLNQMEQQQNFVSGQINTQKQDFKKIEQGIENIDKRQQNVQNEIGNDDDIYYF